MPATRPAPSPPAECQLLSVPQPLSPAAQAAGQVDLWPQVIQQAPSAQSKPETSLRPSPSACLSCLRLASGPAQPATRHPASGPSVYETGPPSTAHPSSSSPCLRSLVAEPSFRPNPTSDPGASQSVPAGPQIMCVRPTAPAPQSGCPSSSAQAGQALTSCLRLAPSHPHSLRLVSKYARLRLASGPVPQPACWRVLHVPSQQLATQPQAQVCMKQALPIQQPGPVPDFKPSEQDGFRTSN